MRAEKQKDYSMAVFQQKKKKKKKKKKKLLDGQIGPNCAQKLSKFSKLFPVLGFPFKAYM